MSATVRLDKNVLVVEGEVNPATVVGVRREGERLIDQAGAGLRVDLIGITAAHSVVLSLILCWLRYAEAHHCHLQVSGAGDRLCSLAALSGLHHYIPGLVQADPDLSL